jgi:hypothetical protein
MTKENEKENETKKENNHNVANNNETTINAIPIDTSLFVEQEIPDVD